MNLPVSDDHHLIRLDEFLPEGVHTLEVPLGAHLLHGLHEDLVVRLRQDHSGEEIRDDTLKQRYVVGQKLWKIDVEDGTQQLKMSRGK